MLADVLALWRWADFVFVGGKTLDGRVVDRGLDTIVFHEVDELGAVDVLCKQDGHDVVGGRSAIVVTEGHGEEVRQAIEAAKIVRNAGSACGVGFRQLGKLDKAEGCAHFIDAVVKAWLEHIVGGGATFNAVEASNSHAMRAQVLALLVEFRIARDDHAAFSHREVLVGEETPGRYIAKGTKLAALVGAAIRMRTILDELEIMPLADIDNRIHIAGIARIVHDHHRLGARRDLGLDIGRIHCPIGH